MSAASYAVADVDTTGSLRKVTSSFSPLLSEPAAGFEKASGDYECAGIYYSDIQNAADSFVIGNWKAPWQIDVVSYSPPNGNGIRSYGGDVTGAFSGCGWIEARFEPEKINKNSNSACSEGSTGDFEVPESSFMYMDHHNSAAGMDGTWSTGKHARSTRITGHGVKITQSRNTSELRQHTPLKPLAEPPQL
ncbi:MAG: hypothetical protein WAU42_05725 [Solirubrobacteraceae bacterium]